MRRRVLAALLLSVLLPGCSLFRGSANEAVSGPHVDVKVVTVGPQPVSGQLFLAQGQSEVFAHNVSVPANSSVEKGVSIHPNVTATLRLSYTTDAAGRASRGSVATTVEPAICTGVYRVTFTLHTDEPIVTASGASECVP